VNHVEGGVPVDEIMIRYTLRKEDESRAQFVVQRLGLAPTWDGRVECVPKRDNCDYQNTVETLVDQCKEGEVVNIFGVGAYSNRNRADSKQLGAASAVLYHKGRDWRHTERIFGETVTESDTEIRSFLPALDVLSDFLATQQPDTHLKANIASPSNPAIGRIIKATPHEEQDVTIESLRKIGELMETYPNLKIRLLWLPRKIAFVGFKRARQLALEAIRTADPKPEDEPHTIKNQKKRTKQTAIATWAERWHTAPRSSLAYRTALTRPPDGKPHPTFLTGKETAKFHRSLHCTMYRIITGHAFTGAYTQRFFNRHTPDQIACECGEPIQTVEHVLLECPNHTAARRKHLTVGGRLRNLAQLFNHPKRAEALLLFLRDTGACAKPRAEWEPG
jgi:hypothetical protein